MILADDAAVDNFFLLSSWFACKLQELGAGWDVFTTFCCIIERYDDKIWQVFCKLNCKKKRKYSPLSYPA